MIKLLIFITKQLLNVDYSGSSISVVFIVKSRISFLAAFDSNDCHSIIIMYSPFFGFVTVNSHDLFLQYSCPWACFWTFFNKVRTYFQEKFDIYVIFFRMKYLIGVYHSLFAERSHLFSGRSTY